MTHFPVQWQKGSLYSLDSSAVPAGYRLGDGVFETVRTYFGKPFRLADHISRLLAGAESIGFHDLPEQGAVMNKVSAVLEEWKPGKPEDEYVLRPTFFSEGQGWGFMVPVETWRPPIQFMSGKGITVGISAHRHPGSYMVPPSGRTQVKWLSRGQLSHALRVAREKGWGEALLLNHEGKVVEGTRSNLFVLTEDTVIAPGALSSAFPGITREVVIELAERRGIAVLDRPASLQELISSSEIFLTSTLLGVAPVDSVQIGEDTYAKPAGKVSGLIVSDFARQVSRECH